MQNVFFYGNFRYGKRRMRVDDVTLRIQLMEFWREVRWRRESVWRLPCCASESNRWRMKESSWGTEYVEIQASECDWATSSASSLRPYRVAPPAAECSDILEGEEEEKEGDGCQQRHMIGGEGIYGSGGAKIISKGSTNSSRKFWGLSVKWEWDIHGQLCFWPVRRTYV